MEAECKEDQSQHIQIMTDLHSFNVSRYKFQYEFVGRQ